ncbi:MAG: hypothetical protein ACJ766_13465 [Thermoleophilaceae bacterium]
MSVEIHRWDTGGCGGSGGGGGGSSAKADFRIVAPEGQGPRPQQAQGVRDDPQPGRQDGQPRGSRYYACRKRSIWNDRGDVAGLLGPKGHLVSQRGFGRFRGAARF